VLKISQNVSIADDEIECSHLRFDINASTLPDFYKQRLLALKDRRISKEGVVIIKAQKFRTREKNQDDALQRLQELIRGAAVVQKARKPTRPTKASRKRRLDSKTRKGRTKGLRGKVVE